MVENNQKDPPPLLNVIAWVASKVQEAKRLANPEFTKGNKVTNQNSHIGHVTTNSQ